MSIMRSYSIPSLKISQSAIGNRIWFTIFSSAPALSPRFEGGGHEATSFHVIIQPIPEEGRNGIIRGYLIAYSKVFAHNNSLGFEMYQLVNMSSLDTLKNFGLFTHGYVVRGLVRDSFYNVSIAGYTDPGVGVRSKMVTVPTGIYGESLLSAVSSEYYFFTWNSD